MVPPIWLDAAGRPRPKQACWTCGREVAWMRYRGDDLRRHGWTPPETLQIPLVRLLHGVPARARQRRLVVPRADLGA